MTHFWLRPETQLETNSWGIPEPVNAESTDFYQAELVIVPMIVGDKRGNRIGYGGGYYDRLVKKYNGQTVGLSLYDLQTLLPSDPWDVHLEKIFSP